MKRGPFSQSVGSQLSAMMNSEPTLQGLFNSIDSYKEKKPDIQTALTLIDRLLTEKPELIFESDHHGNTALIYACSRKQHPLYPTVKLRTGPNYEIVNLLLHYGANPNARNNDQRTPLHYACKYQPARGPGVTGFVLQDDRKQLIKVVRKLIKAGGDLRLHDNENMRPIDYTRRIEANSKFRKEMLQFLEQQQESFSNFQRTRQKIELGTPHRVKLTKPAKTSGMFGKNYDFCLEQPRVKQLGYGAVIDHVGGKLSTFGEAASIPFAENDQIFDHRGEQKLRFRVLKFTVSRKLWRGTQVSVMALDNVATEDDKYHKTRNYKVDRHDLLTLEVAKNSSIRHRNILLMMGISHDPISYLIRGLVYERIDIGNLKYCLQMQQNLPPEEWIVLMQQIVDGTEFLHESGIIHQAICPETIMICDHRTAKLGMLCFSRMINDSSKNWEAERIPEKMHRFVAPEILNGRNTERGLPREASDVYSICATIFNLLMGEEPWAEVVNAKIRDMAEELIGNEIQPEGGIEEVLLPPIRAGLKRSLRERKTRLKDINYHLENLIKVYRAYEFPQHEIRTIGTSSQDLIGHSSYDVMTGSITGSVDRKSHSLVGSKSGSRKAKNDVNQSPVSSRVSSISKSFSLRKSNSIMTRPVGLPMGLPKRCTSLKEFQKTTHSNMPDYFMDKNHNKSLMQMEYEQPIHIEHETESTDEETENPTENDFSAANSPIKEPTTPMAHVDRYINEQFDLSQTNLAGAVMNRQLGHGGQVTCEDTWNTSIDDHTPVRNQVKRGATNRSRVSLLNLQDQQEITTNQIKPKASQSDTNMSKMQNLEDAHLALSASRSRIEHQENILAALENRVSSLFNDSVEETKNADTTPNNLVELEKPSRPSTTSLRSQILKRPSTAPARSNTSLNRKNVTINSDLNEEYQITPNQTQYITADEPSQDSPEGLAHDSDNELAMGENVDLNEKFVCPHEGVLQGLPIPTQPARIHRMEINEASDQFLNNLQSLKHSLKQVPLIHSELHGQEECKITQHEFQNHVETQVHDQPLPGTRPSPDYLEPDLIQQKEQMRDTNQIPRIVVESPGVELPILRSSCSQNLIPKPSMLDESFPPPPNPAEQAKLSLKPVLKRQDDVDENQCATDGQFEAMDTTRTPSRLTFNEKVKKFRAISMDLDPSEGPSMDKPPLIQSTKSTMKMMDEIDSNLLAATSAADFMTSTPAVHRSIPPKQKSSATTLTAQMFVSENINRAVEQIKEKDDIVGREISEDIKRMIDASNDKHFPARVQMDRNKILATCAVHKTLSESAEFQDIDYDDSSSVLSDASESEEVAQNISMWEEGIDEEPIVGNELVNIRQIDLQNNRLQQEEHEDDEEDIEEKLIVPSFDFEKTHQVSNLTDTLTEEPTNDIDGRLTGTAPRDHYRLMPSTGMTPRRDDKQN